jgi:hypothetical protein
MEKQTTAQKLGATTKDEFDQAEKYYAILSVINNLNLAPREIQLVAFTAIKGNITYGNARAEFCERYGSSSATIGNIICKLRKLHIFIKEKGMVKVNPQLVLDFNNNLILQISLINGKE